MSTAPAVRTAQEVLADERIVSADSHIIEPVDLWEKNLTPSLKTKYPKFPPRNSPGEKPGGWDPKARLGEMEVDGVSAEVLYPTFGLRLFALEDADVQEACFQIANDWLIEYCKVAPGRLVGIPMISLYNIPNSIKELERCKKAGLVGSLIWQVPPEHLPFTSDYYDPFWEASQDLNMPVNLHILTGFNYSRFERKGLDIFKATVNTKLADAAGTLFDLVFSGVTARFPKLKFVYVENEVGWIPFYVHEWDKYYVRFKSRVDMPYMKKLPGEYVAEQVYATFFSDPAGGRLMEDFGQDTFMWSNDYPHAASTWPHSRNVIARELGHLPKDILKKVVRENVIKLYDLKIDGINA
ncbi:MAG TPA: amidohydrolase family protein [Candidatus Acidoferrales bacterium]|jgi:predicted TIM-barrel fold metal-dependent hydrolase|nr:amidohydrolase family protein [Candidatus Acidoferrales bacterium]